LAILMIRLMPRFVRFITLNKEKKSNSTFCCDCPPQHAELSDIKELNDIYFWKHFDVSYFVIILWIESSIPYCLLISPDSFCCFFILLFDRTVLFCSLCKRGYVDVVF
jgi:hypothetical protein